MSERRTPPPLPAGWSSRRIGDVCTIFGRIGFRGYTVADIVPEGQGAISLSPSNIQNGKLKIEKNTFISWEKWAESPEIKIENGDIVIVKTGSTVGKTALVRNLTEPATLNPQLVVLKKRSINEIFLGYIAASEDFQNQLSSTAVGGALPTLSQKEIASYLFLCPDDPNEQQAIAAALSDADGVVAGLERVIAKKRLIKQGAMQDLLTARRRLPGFSGGWEEVSVGEVVLKSFCGPSPTCEERMVSGDEWGVLKTTAITVEAGWDWSKHKVLPRMFWGNQNALVESGDVIVTKAGPRHRVGVAASVDFVPRNILVSGKMIGLRPNPQRVTSLMLSSAISSKQTQFYLDQRTTGMAESQVNFNNSDLLLAPIRLPPIQEQQAISTISSDMDAEIQTLESRLAKARAVQEGMMQNLLTGRVRLV